MIYQFCDTLNTYYFNLKILFYYVKVFVLTNVLYAYRIIYTEIYCIYFLIDFVKFMYRLDNVHAFYIYECIYI